MEFRKLTVKNFCQHTLSEMEIPRGITGVIGKNGKGKSNLSQVGLLYALTGLTVGTTTKKDLIKWGSANFQTTLLFNKNNIEYILKRSSNSASIAWVEDGEPKTIKGVTGVDEYLNNLLGMSMLVIKETCFASQGTLLDIISMTHMKRLEYFQKVCGTRIAEVLRGVLQSSLNKIPNYIDRKEVIEELKAQIQDKEDTFTKISSKYNLLKDSITTLEKDIPKVQEELKKPVKSIFDTIVLDLDKHITELKTKLKEDTVEYPKELPLITVERISNRKNYFHKLKYEENLKEMKDKLNTFLQLPAPEVDMEEYDNARKIVQECYQGYMDFRKQYDLVSKGTCPTCGQEFQQDLNIIAENLEQARLIYEEAKSTSDDIAVKFRSAQASLKSYEKTYNEIKYGIDTLEANLADPTYDVVHDEEQYIKDEESDKILNDLRKKAIASKEITERLERQLQKLEIEQSNYINSGYITDKIKAEYETVLSNYKKDSEILHEYKITMSVLESEVNNTYDLIEVYNKEQSAFEKSKEDIKLLENCRAVLHKEYLPKMVMRRIVGRLNRCMLRYLERFNTTFTGYLTEDFDFFVDYVSGGREKPAKSLSGGQKVALAIAFRFALADLLGVAVPLLVLDEPTVHLDDDNVECVASVLETAKTKVATGMHMVIATHQPLLMRGFSSIIEIN